MNSHAYAYGQLVERISTGERAAFLARPSKTLIRVGISHILSGTKTALWFADDCRPALGNEAATQLTECGGEA